MKANTILYVRDQKRATEFYSQVLGTQPILDVPGMTEFRLSEDHVLGLMPEAGIKRLLGDAISDPTASNGASRAELYLTVASPEHHHALALANGGKELSPYQKRNWGDCAAYSLDLDGHVLVFANRESPVQQTAHDAENYSIAYPNPILLKTGGHVSDLTIREGYNPAWLSALMDLHNKTEMKRGNQKQVGAAFHSSFAVVTAWIANRLVGCGRMISDGQMYSGIFDVVVDPKFQKHGVGRAIMEHLIAKAPGTCIHLTSTFGNETFYARLGFKKHKTAMALYPGKMAVSAYLKPLPKEELFHGMVVEESLSDPTILNSLAIEKVKITTPGRWHIYTLSTGAEQIASAQKALKHGWYMHFWRGVEMRIVFADAIFSAKLDDKSTWAEAIAHGLGQGIPEAQLDFLTE